MLAVNPAPLSPLGHDEAIRAFVSRLSIVDVVDRFGYYVALPRVASLLVPHGPATRAIGAWYHRSLVGITTLVRAGHGNYEVGVLVLADLRRQRIGSALMRSALRTARNAGACRVTAYTRADNRAALKLLRSTGFSRLGEFASEMIFSADLSQPMPGVELPGGNKQLGTQPG